MTSEPLTGWHKTLPRKLTSQSQGSLLIASVSGRALARAAAEAGFVPLVADFFADLDTQALSYRAYKVPGDLSNGFDWASLEPVLGALSQDAPSPIIGLINGSGFEDRPELLDQIAERWPLLGNDAPCVSAVSDPARFFTSLARLSIPHAETRLEPPRDLSGWLAKRLGGAGGSHVVPADERPTARNVYFQKVVPGRQISLLFAANGTRSIVLGISEQWTSPTDGKPYRFGGACQPARARRDIAQNMSELVSRAAQHFRLKGLNSADFLLDGDEAVLLEINPRPGRTLDIFANAEPALIRVHLDALLDSRLPTEAPAVDGATASATVFAPRRLAIPELMNWPAWAVDLPIPGERIDKEYPICTVLAGAGSADAARRLVQARTSDILAMLSANGALSNRDRVLAHD